MIGLYLYLVAAKMVLKIAGQAISNERKVDSHPLEADYRSSFKG